MSNEILKRCSQGIPLKEVFDGDEESCRVALKESIHANEAWKRLYSTMVDVACCVHPEIEPASPSIAGHVAGHDSKSASLSAHGVGSEEPVKSLHKKAMDKDTRKVSDWNAKIIFAPVEAFLQRCRDMLEVIVVFATFLFTFKDVDKSIQFVKSPKYVDYNVWCVWRYSSFGA